VAVLLLALSFAIIYISAGVLLFGAEINAAIHPAHEAQVDPAVVRP